jgi:putative serine protease PepD
VSHPRRILDRRVWNGAVAIAVLVPFLVGLGWTQPISAAPALRSAVPLLCTENHQAARTRVRGTGLIVDSGGTLLTAAHVIQQAHNDCTLSVMIPDDEWSRFRQFHAFLIKDCRLLLPLDLAVCRIRPADSSRDWGYLRPAQIRARLGLTGEPVSITSFAGWGLSPLVRSGHIQGRQIYQRKDGCYCDFATDIAAVEGMSGSPVINAQGEVIGILTLAGSGKFRGLSFGASLAEAADFLKTEGVPTMGDQRGSMGSLPGKR